MTIQPCIRRLVTPLGALGILAAASTVATAQKVPGALAGTAAANEANATAPKAHASRVTAPKATTPTVGALDTTKVVTIQREVFHYSAAGKRDPFVSLLATSDIRPVIGDLRITAIAYDPHGGKSVAILRDVGTHEQYRGTVGAQIGRMRIVRIEPKSVTFMIEEFGFSRQETLTMGDTSLTRTP